MSAADRFNRIVALVAEMTRDERAGRHATSLNALAERHGVSVKDLTADIRTLTMLGDHADADWLLSLRIWQQEDEVSLTSAGPFRRPVRLSPEEQLAIQMALALDPDGAALGARLASLWAGESAEPPIAPEQSPVAIIRRAAREHLTLELDYAGESQRDMRTRRIQPHQVAESGVRTYIVAWAEDVGAWRHFRLDRIVAVRITDSHFEPRSDFEPMVNPRDAFRPSGATDRVTVRFRPEVAPWVTEFYTEHRRDEDGSITVQFEATSTDWLVRRVLEFGADAEVVTPANYRDAVVRAVA